MKPSPLIVWEGRRYRVMVRIADKIPARPKKWWHLAEPPKVMAGGVIVQRIDYATDGGRENDAIYPQIVPVTELAEAAERMVDALRLIEAVAPEPDPAPPTEDVKP